MASKKYLFCIATIFLLPIFSHAAVGDRKCDEPGSNDNIESSPIVGAGWGGADSVELTDATWDKEVVNSDQNWIVAFYTTWCGYSKKLKPEWVKVGNQLKGSNVRVGHVDGDKSKKTKNRYSKVNGYPTILMFTNDNKDGDNEYPGENKAPGIVRWAKEQAQ